MGDDKKNPEVAPQEASGGEQSPEAVSERFRVLTENPEETEKTKSESEAVRNESESEVSENVNETLEIAVSASISELPEKEKKEVKKVLKKKNEKKLSPREKELVLATGLMTLRKLKEYFNTPQKMASVLENLKTHSGKNTKIANSPLIRLFDRIKVLQIFKKSADESDGILNMVGVDEKDRESLSKMKKLRHGIQLTDEEEDGIKVVLSKKIFIGTSRIAVDEIFEHLKKAVVRANLLNPKLLAELVFLVDENDYKRMIALFVGSHRYSKLNNAA